MRSHPPISGRGPQSIGKTVARFAIGVALGGAALWLTFRSTDIGRVAGAVSNAHAWPILGSLVLVALTVAVAAERWRLIVFRPPERGGSHRRFAAALVTAQMLNVLLPMRAGEVGRAYWISRSEGVPLGRVAVTVIVERLLDMLMLGASITIVLVLLIAAGLGPNLGGDGARCQCDDTGRGAGAGSCGAGLYCVGSRRACSICRDPWGPSSFDTATWPSRRLPR